MTIRVVIADDEPVALDHLRRMLAFHADVQIVGEAHDGADAADTIRREQPDAAILDVQMPEIDGIGVLRLLGGEWEGRVIFATAHESYAVSAFELRALDYMLKPIAPERLAESLARLRLPADVSGQVTGHQTLSEMLCATAPLPPLERLAVVHLGTTLVVPIDDVEWVEAADNYVRLHCTAARSYLLRAKLTALEARLDARRFMRVHRSHIVRLDSIQRLDEWSRGGLLLMLRSGAKVEVSRGHRKRLMAQLSM